jgi:membrane protein implicated in regulation of membrane protease activity
MILDALRQLGPWSWLIIGAVLLALELAAPGNVFVWFGIAAMLTGVLDLFTELSWQIDLLVFVVLAAVLAVAGRRYFARPEEAGEQPLLNARAVRLVGGVHVLSEPIVNGTGRIRIDDTNWRIAGTDAPSGTRVKITGVDGAVLTVVSVEG